ncbi:RrF2 family transcriptional regulator [Arthrobacter roseus]|uniref:RrF2 family transcriptional regulator n=1 Tax=Arthrobacter roseus TaxID=136274 RepID=UPI001964A2D8|nr:Rrf2 family transcriptional regulator [Arthrobacter roseus]MBM7847625.1 Rrf2 family nitric oxide-sensitive transcriptional repressor [Arthrobacter roseus]
MRINSFADLCLRMVMLIASTPPGAQFTTREISAGVHTPYNHVSKAVLRLRDLGVVNVYRGRNGGVQLSPVGRNISVGWLLRELDTRIDMADCESLEVACPLSNNCRLRHALNSAREAFYASLDSIVLADLPHEEQMKPVFESIGLRPGL